MPDRPAAPPAPPAPHDERRVALLDAAMGVFARYGYKKASMDEVARAAGLSRQGLYLHFSSKEALFRDVLSFVLERSLGAGRAALGGAGPIEDRLVAAFDAAYGQHVGAGLGVTPHIAELIEASTQLVGGLVSAEEAAFRAAVAAALEAAGVPGRGSAAGLSALDLAATLDAVACGLKHRAASRAEFVARFRQAARLACA